MFILLYYFMQTLCIFDIASTKMSLHGNCRICLEDDGTVVDDDEILEELTRQTFLILTEAQFWSPVTASTVVDVIPETNIQQTVVATEVVMNYTNPVSAVPGTSLTAVESTSNNPSPKPTEASQLLLSSPSTGLCFQL
jgi:hypothetical protein